MPYPDQGDYWDLDDVYNIAAWVETLSYRVYSVMQNELVEPSPWNLETLAVMYDVVIAARIYFDAVAGSRAPLRDTLYELFNLDEAVSVASARVLCGPLSPRARDNFMQLRYYVDELLWQYRLDTDEGMFSASNAPIIGAAQFRLSDESHEHGNDQVITCESFGFPWSKPHREVVWDLSGINGFTAADTLVIGSLNSASEQGRSGVARVSALIVTYNDGTQSDLVARARALRDSHITSKGELVLADSMDRIYLPLDSHRGIDSIYMRADSWIAPKVDAVISLALVRSGEHGLALKNP